MGATQPKCILCGSCETEKNPVLEVHSRGKRNGQMICFKCIKKKLYKKFERRLNRRDSFIENEES